MDIIFLHGVRARTLIGCYDWEREAPQPVELDLDIGLPSSRACQTDNLTDTIDYASVVNRIHTELAAQHFLLLEALAEHLAQVLLRDFSAPWVRVSVTKPGILPDVARAGVTVERGQRH
ncbi:7,8-dihydroneopterin aldolase [Chitiniphilus shinanonensis]|uniref:dihydroneopterin aldolase n=1 Tax=Chitiniphilus shinanonensis TaxID=553088 RepID=A0ABQ6BP41_9NEIS|nr:dihydroneopterin aldolase [Chitiniphilus shinanonensis]GLS03222.1 7,8-dihydroneopterin aldolase [Chitiniphilus shinanonensis]